MSKTRGHDQNLRILQICAVVQSLRNFLKLEELTIIHGFEQNPRILLYSRIVVKFEDFGMNLGNLSFSNKDNIDNLNFHEKNTQKQCTDLNHLFFL